MKRSRTTRDPGARRTLTVAQPPRLRQGYGGQASAVSGSDAPVEIWDANACFGVLAFKDADYSLTALRGLMASHGIARAAAYSLKGAYYDFQEGNDETVAAAQADQRLLPVATVDPRRGIGCLEEVSLRARQGCRALRFFPDVQGWAVGFLPLRPLLEEAQRRGMAVMLPAGAAGGPTEALQALRGLELPLILMGANYDTMAETIAAAQARPNTYIETHRLVPPQGIDVAAQAVGHERLVFGSGAPEVYPGSALALIQHSGLTSQQRRDVLCGNLKRALGFEPR